MLPEHPPKVLRGLCQWSLCCNVGFLLPAEMNHMTKVGNNQRGRISERYMELRLH